MILSVSFSYLCLSIQHYAGTIRSSDSSSFLVFTSTPCVFTENKKESNYILSIPFIHTFNQLQLQLNNKVKCMFKVVLKIIRH